MEWVHCNNCFIIPSQNTKFYFSSCGHILCANCIKKDGTKTPNAVDSCCCCKKKANILEINRNLRPEIQIYFRNPKDLTNQYMQNLKTVMDFQNHQRSRLMKYQQEQMSKAVKYAHAAREELNRRATLERTIVGERNHLKAELEKQAATVQNLKLMLSERDRELHMYKHLKEITPSGREKNLFPYRPFDSIPTPTHTLSFAGVVTSTPLDALAQPARTKQNLFLGPDSGINSPMTSCGSSFLTTPAMLGIKKPTKRPCSAPKQGDNFF